MERKAEFNVPARATGEESPSWQSPEPEEKACAAVRQWENLTLKSYTGFQSPGGQPAEEV